MLAGLRLQVSKFLLKANPNDIPVYLSIQRTWEIVIGVLYKRARREVIISYNWNVVSHLIYNGS
jgi:hypothetical protein